MCIPSLECILVSAAGVDHIDLAECRRRGIEVANAGDVFPDDTSDYALGLLIDVLQRFQLRIGSFGRVCGRMLESLGLVLGHNTCHMINEDVMMALGKEGVIINVSRGALIDEKELVHFLVEGKISGVGLDVFENEPDVPKELVVLNNVVLSPHKVISTPESFKALEEIVVENLEAFFSNPPLRSPVTFH